MPDWCKPMEALCSIPTLSVSIVVYCPDLALLEKTLKSLSESLKVAQSQGVVKDAELVLVDNDENSSRLHLLSALLETVVPGFKKVILKHGHGNIGYGRGHNLGIQESKSMYHLVLNPDVVMSSGALIRGIQSMERNPGSGLLSPKATTATGEPLYLNKRYPALLVLAFRGLSSITGNETFARLMLGKRLDAYALNDINPDKPFFSRSILVSGSFMHFRRRNLETAGGFSKEFFLYFEDYDLSIRISKISSIVYDPLVRIVHYGGGTARKGVRHIFWFLRSALLFFNKHGWKFL